MPKKQSLVLALLLVFLVAAFSASGTVEAQNVVLRAVTAWPENDDANLQGFWWLQEAVRSISDGRVEIQWLGGPEVIPPFELAEAVRDGAVDLAWLSPAYYIPQLPEVSVLDYSELTFAEELASGALDYLNEIHHRKLNVHVIGSGDGGSQYSIYTSKRVESVDDFKGLRIRVSPSYLPLIQALGAQTVLLPGGEIYTAMERGVIDGFTWPSIGITAMRLEELTRYKIEPQYWRVSRVSIINYDRWQSLPDDVKRALEQASRRVESMLPAYYEQELEKENELLQSQYGVEIIRLRDADVFLQIALEAGWERVRELVGDEADELIARFRRTTN